MASDRRGKTLRKDTDASTDSAPHACPFCADPDPQVRHRHYLRLAHTEDMKVLEDHLTIECHRRSRREPEDIRRGIVEVLAWVGGEMSTWAGLADATTGAPLPWWEARAQAHAARRAQEHAARADTATHMVAGMMLLGPVLQKLMAGQVPTPETPRHEPEDIANDWPDDDEPWPDAPEEERD